MLSEILRVTNPNAGVSHCFTLRYDRILSAISLLISLTFASNIPDGVLTPEMKRVIQGVCWYDRVNWGFNFGGSSTLLIAFQ